MIVDELSENNKPLPAYLVKKYNIANRLFASIKKKAGLHRLKLCFTGGGPIHPDILKFFRAIGIELYEGYGLTETSPVINLNTPKHQRAGSVGKPIPTCEQKIAQDGEILVRGPMVMLGYHHDEKATQKVISKEGWLATGDIGFIDEEGFLYITDRKKEIIITSGGKSIAPQPIETLFKPNPHIEHICVIGDGQRFIAALITLNDAAVKRWAEDNNISFENNTAMAHHSEVKALIQKGVEEVNQGLGTFEQIKKFEILEDPFSETTGELTPSQKMKRRIITEKYHDLIEHIYHS